MNKSVWALRRGVGFRYSQRRGERIPDVGKRRLAIEFRMPHSGTMKNREDLQCSYLKVENQIGWTRYG